MDINNQFSQSQGDPQVVIVGSGLVAKICALAMLRLGLRVQLNIETQQTPAEQTHIKKTQATPRTFAIAPHVAAWLQSLDIWHALPAAAQQDVARMQIFDSASTSTQILSAYEANLPKLCTIVDETALLRVVDAALQTAQMMQGQGKLSLVENAKVEMTNPPNAQSGALYIAADGAQSAWAQALGLTQTVHDYAQSAVVAMVQVNTATSNNFLAATGTAHQWMGGAEEHSDVLALLPMTAGQYGVVWSCAPADAQRRAADVAVLVAELNARIAKNTNKEIITASDLVCAIEGYSPGVFPLTRANLSAAVLPQLGFAAVGDALRRVHPLAGQGLNLGLEDVMALAAAVQGREHWRAPHSPRVLERYARARAERSALVQNVIHGLATRGSVVQSNLVSKTLVKIMAKIKIPAMQYMSNPNSKRTL